MTAVEVLTTIALRPGMHVRDRSDRCAVEHVYAGRQPIGDGQWDVAFADTPVHVQCGARHGWAVAE